MQSRIVGIKVKNGMSEAAGAKVQSRKDRIKVRNDGSLVGHIGEGMTSIGNEVLCLSIRGSQCEMEAR